MHGDKVKNLGEAILHWLCFQDLCGRSCLLSESYLSQPIGEYLLHHHSGTLDAEVEHPNFKSGGKGRPRQIDFCLISRDSKKITTAFELKWISETTVDKQKIIDDLLRLEALRVTGTTTTARYFIVAGKKDDFSKNFTKAVANHEKKRIPFFTEFIDFSAFDLKTVNYSKLSEPQRKCLDSFADNYAVECPKSFSSTLIYRDTKSGFSVYIWLIKSSQNRKSITNLTSASSATY